MCTQLDFEQAIRDYSKLIFSICHSMTRDYFVAEDLTQETFVAAYQHLASFRGGSIKAWLTTIAANKCRDYLKSASRRSIATPDEQLDVVADTDTPEKIVLERSAQEQLQKACQGLKEPYQTVAFRYFCQETPLSAIAAETGQNLKTLQTQLYRAKGMLKKRWKEDAQ